MPVYCPYPDCQHTIPPGARQPTCQYCGKGLHYYCRQMVAGNHPCGYVVNIGATRCTATPSHGAVSPNPPPSTDLHCQCPHCGVNLPDKRYKCPYCGQDFVYKCPLCGTTMNSTDTTCPNPACGHTFLTICPQMP